MTVLEALAKGCLYSVDVVRATGKSDSDVLLRLWHLEDEKLIQANHSGTHSTYHLTNRGKASLVDKPSSWERHGDYDG